MRKAQRFFKGLGLLLLSVVWCLPSTALGLLFAVLLFPFSTFSEYRGMIVLYHPFDFTLRLGEFAFISNRVSAPEAARGAAYGHYLASLAWGPLFLFVITIPSFLSRIPSVERKRAERGLSRFDFYPERYPASLAKRFGE
ncbi:MAG: hypothetical protein K5753_06150 [Clostridia bacterium]|nr:hypothetical protein [Clostridia bacterium]